MLQMMDKLTSFCKEHKLLHTQLMDGAGASLKERLVDIEGRPSLLFEVGALKSTMKVGAGQPITIGSLAALETELLKALQAPFKLNMTQMLATVVAFFKESCIQYTPPKLTPKTTQLNVAVNDYPQFLITELETSSTIRFLNQRGGATSVQTQEALKHLLQKAAPIPKEGASSEPGPVLKRAKVAADATHHCEAPQQPHQSQPFPVLPHGAIRQPGARGLTIDAMTAAVVAFLNEAGYSYELPAHYSRADVHADFHYYVPELFIELKHSSGFHVPPISYHEAYKTATETMPAFLIWHGFGCFPKTADDITKNLVKGQATFDAHVHDYCGSIADKAIDTYALEQFIRKTIDNISKTRFEDVDTSYEVIFKKIHAAAVEAIMPKIKPKPR
jgi:hypothetical protein